MSRPNDIFFEYDGTRKRRVSSRPTNALIYDYPTRFALERRRGNVDDNYQEEPEEEVVHPPPRGNYIQINLEDMSWTKRVLRPWFRRNWKTLLPFLAFLGILFLLYPYITIPNIRPPSFVISNESSINSEGVEKLVTRLIEQHIQKAGYVKKDQLKTFDKDEAEALKKEISGKIEKLNQTVQSVHNLIQSLKSDGKGIDPEYQTKLQDYVNNQTALKEYVETQLQSCLTKLSVAVDIEEMAKNISGSLATLEKQISAERIIPDSEKTILSQEVLKLIQTNITKLVVQEISSHVPTNPSPSPVADITKDWVLAELNKVSNKLDEAKVQEIIKSQIAAYKWEDAIPKTWLEDLSKNLKAEISANLKAVNLSLDENQKQEVIQLIDDSLDGDFSEKIVEVLGEMIKDGELNQNIADQQITALREEVAELKKATQKEEANRKVDWALQSLGGRIYYARTSPGYSVRRVWPNYFSTASEAENIIHPDTSPGKCFSFEGHQGNVTVILVALVNVTEVSIDHISAESSINIGSAPREFKIWGYTNTTDPGTYLGRGAYDIKGKLVQTFKVQHPAPAKLVTLQVLSNHGYEKYTCIYRFRVHGTMLEEGTQLNL